MRVPFRTFPSGPEVDYTQFREHIQPGDILLCSGSAWFSRMIQRATRSVWSHVGFVMILESIDRVMVLESVESSGVRTVPLSKYLSDYDSQGNAYPGGLVIARHQQFGATATEAARRKFGQFAVSLFGYPYDKGEIAKIAARIAASFLPFSSDEKRELERDKEYICSEYAWECYNSIGVTIEPNRGGFIAPADFAKCPEVTLEAVLKEK